VYGLQAGRSGQGNCLFRTSRPAVEPTQPHAVWVPMFFTGVKRPRRDADHSLPSTTAVKNEWSCPPAHHICLRCVGKDNFTFTCDTVTDMNRY
jgi:hypothetical protein